MKAIFVNNYGSVDVLKQCEIEKPVPKDDEILIKIHATSVTAGDITDRKFDIPLLFWLPMGIVFGFKKPKRKIPGADLAGEVEKIGKNVSRFRIGDKVFACTGFKSGAYAQYICLHQDGLIALKPQNISFEQAAAIPFGATTALYFLEKSNIKNGQKVLVNGASGGVGTYAVQIAKYYGAKVTAVCSTKNFEFVRSIGADQMIDYTKEDFTDMNVIYDVIFDTVGKLKYSKCKKSLSKRGYFLSTYIGLKEIMQMLITSMSKKCRKVIIGIANPKTEHFYFLKDLVEGEKMMPVIDRIYTFDKMAEAHEYVEQGHKKGNVSISIKHD